MIEKFYKVIKTTTKIILIYFFYYLRIYKITNIFRHIFRGDNFLVLVYHSFSENCKSEPGLKLFEKHIKFLKDNYNVETLDNVIQAIKMGEKIKRDTVCITIDDGYLDNYEIAYPIFRKYNLEATIFLASGYIRERDLLLGRNNTLNL